MRTLVIIPWSLIFQPCYSQLKACYQAVEEELAGDFPCDPDADVSSCCASGNICSSNLYCISASNQQNYVGTCTDKTWSSPACPFNLSSGKFDPNYDKFNYALNTTQCPNGTLCPFSNNPNCCNTNHGIKEVHYNYTSSAVMPTDVSELTTFYAAAGYTFPTSVPSSSASFSGLSSSSEVHAAATTTLSATSVPGSSGTRQSVKTGLGVGITLSVLVCGVCAILLHLSVRRRRRRQQDDMQKGLKSQTPTVLHGYNTELEGTPGRSELEAWKQVYELHENSIRSFKNQS